MLAEKAEVSLNEGHAGCGLGAGPTAVVVGEHAAGTAVRQGWDLLVQQNLEV